MRNEAFCNFVVSNLGVKICHQKCKQFQELLVDDFARLFKMYTDVCKKENETNNRLVIALEKCDQLDYEVVILKQQLS